MYVWVRDYVVLSKTSAFCRASLQVRRDLHLSKKKLSDGVLLRVFSHMDDDNNGGIELEVQAYPRPVHCPRAFITARYLSGRLSCYYVMTTKKLGVSSTTFARTTGTKAVHSRTPPIDCRAGRCSSRQGI